MVTHQLQVERGTGKVRRSKTNVLPLCHATNHVVYDGAVYVMLAFESEFEGMLIAMQQRDLLDGGEYFLIGVDSKPYDASHPRLYKGST